MCETRVEYHIACDPNPNDMSEAELRGAIREIGFALGLEYERAVKPQEVLEAARELRIHEIAYALGLNRAEPIEPEAILLAARKARADVDELGAQLGALSDRLGTLIALRRGESHGG
jgi:hypothetical protein